MKNSVIHILFNRSVLKKACCIFLLLLCANYSVKAQSSTIAEYRVKAVFLFNFTRFIEWPSTAFESPTSPFVIGIIGNDPFGESIDETVTGEKIESHPIIVQRFKDVKEINGCHILFINYNDADEVKEVLSQAQSKPVLTVNEMPGFARWGGMVRFFSEDNKIRLQINASAVKSVQLNISSKLLSVAQIY